MDITLLTSGGGTPIICLVDRMQASPDPLSGGTHLRAAIYVRVSTPDQRVESQLYDLRDLAAQRGFEVVHEYEDRGVCGKKARRPGLDLLMADARKKKFSVVLVAAFDRIARSARNFLQLVDELDSLGIVCQPQGGSGNGRPDGASLRDHNFGDCRIGKVTGGRAREVWNAEGAARIATDRSCSAGCRSRAGYPRPPFGDVADSGRGETRHFAGECLPLDERGEQRLQSRHANFERKSWARGSSLGRHDC
jgi:hypothetical protein